MVDLAIELANTTYAQRGEVNDALTNLADLTAWLRRTQAALAVPIKYGDLNASDLERARSLRDAIRGVVSANSADRPLIAADVAVINSCLRAAPIWSELAGTRSLQTRPRHSGSAFDAALAQTAVNAIELLTNGKMRPCGAPGCVMLFVQDRPRREWCSDGCGNRVRAARHYQRVRQNRTQVAE